MSSHVTESRSDDRPTTREGPAETKVVTRRRLALVLALAVLVVIGLIAGRMVWQADPPWVQPALQLSGRIESSETHIGTRMPAQVKFVAVREGDPVHRGQLILQLDDKDLQAKLKGADSGLTVAREMERQARLKVGALEGQAGKAAAASKSLMGHLFGGFTGARAKREKLEFQIDQGESQMRAAKAEVARAQAARDEIAANLSYFNITSPIDGVCVTRSAEPGDTVGPGQILLSIANPRSIYLRGFVPEGSIGAVRIGQPAKVFLDSAPEKPLTARVTAIDNQASFTPENVYFKQDRVKQVFGVKLSIDDPNGLAKPGMPADAQILIANGERTK